MPALSSYSNFRALMHLNKGAKIVIVKNQNPGYDGSILSSQVR